MAQLYLGFKAFDPHELLCHFIAVRAGLYRERGIEVRLLDTTFLPDSQLPANTLQVACGAALSGWLQGAPLKVVFVATDRPLFWLYAGPGIEELADLKGRRVAGFPAIAPPAHFLKLILRQAGIDPDAVMIEAVRDDAARLGLLASGDAGAALISSAIASEQITDMGLRQMLFFGDHLRVPTTGLAVTEQLLHQQGELVSSMVAIFQRSLALIHSDRNLVEEVLRDDFHMPEKGIASTGHLIQNYFTEQGSSASEITDQAVSLMAGELGVEVADIPQTSLYDFQYLTE